jgi:hypothetical protein
VSMKSPKVPILSSYAAHLLALVIPLYTLA